MKPLKKLYDKGTKFVKGVVDKGKALGKKALNKVKDKARGLVGNKPTGEQGLAKAMSRVDGLLRNNTPAPKLRLAPARIKQQFGLASLTMTEGPADQGKETVTVEGLAQRTTATGVVPVGGGAGDPGVSAPGLGRIGTHGSKPSSLRNGPQVHWLESEHIIPFAVGKRLWDMVSLVVPGRGAREDTGQTTIMIYYGAARFKTPDDNRTSANFEAAVARADIKNRLNRARIASEGGDPTALRRYGADLLGLLMQGLRVAKDDAVTRTNAAIVAENNSTTEGSSLTNAQRRAPAGSAEPPLPAPGDVAQAAESQYDNVVNLVEQAL